MPELWWGIVGVYVCFAVLMIRTIWRDERRARRVKKEIAAARASVDETRAAVDEWRKVVMRFKCIDGSTREEKIDMAEVGQMIRSQIMRDVIARAQITGKPVVLIPPGMTMVELVGGPGDGRRWPWPGKDERIVYQRTIDGIVVTGQYRDTHEWKHGPNGMIRVFRCVGVDNE